MKNFSRQTAAKALIAVIGTSLIASSALAAPVTVPLDQARRIAFAGAAASVVVGNHNIADVNVVDERTVMVVGKRRGMTNVVILDRAGRPLFDSEVVVAASDASTVTINRAGVAATYACVVTCEQVGGAAQSGAPAQLSAPQAPGAPATTPATATIAPAQSSANAQ